ncbi:glycosyltransferase [uncultured Parabacteroides sp.]|uniref:glycosyltransferase n=1 Tax=uncultured Parabacteroides sp. TaxID=512312 RepID=UPI00265985E2|nr:glycosyltransferase [uncultured Parabacteroides sp.]
MNVLVSVIMPVYNMAEFVGEAIDSILQQTFFDFEFIIIDDASDDGTDLVIRSYIDKRIVFVRNDFNIGNYASRNKGMRQARGKYIAVMDADDIAMPERLERQIDYLEKHSDILAVGSDCLFLSNDKLKNVVNSYQDILIALLENNSFVHPSLTIRTDKLRQLNGYDEQYYYSADYDLACRLTLLGKVENLAIPLMQYRWHSSQISLSNKGRQKSYADEIRRKYQLSFINRYKSINQSKVEEADIYYPDMGRLICLYTYAAGIGDSILEQQADILLDKIFEDVSVEMPVCLENGLLGVGCGLIYLMRNHFVEGEEDDVLSEIDACLFGALIYMEDETEVDWYGWLRYFRLRILYDRPADWKVYGMTLRQHGVYMLDCLMRGLQKGMDWDKRIISEVELFHQMKLCPTKTAQILSLLTSIDNDRLSFVIPIRVDSAERERNLDVVVEMLSEMEGVDVSILEGDEQPLYRLKKAYKNVRYRFVEDRHPVFHRTKYLNRLLRDAQGAVVGVWDTDVAITYEQILDAVKAIRTGWAVMSFPYDGRFYTLSPEDSDQFVRDRSFERLDELVKTSHLAHGPHSVGGAFLVNRKLYLQSGGENEHFYGWGPEDAERAKRMEILGLSVYRASGPLFHLYHPRKENSWYGSADIELKNRQEFLTVCSMTRDELLQYVRSWHWTLHE